jgi:hypothetical protein
MEFLRFVFSRIFLKHLMIALGIGLFLVLAAFIFLRIYTHHGQAIQVPDLTGLTEEEVGIIMTAKRLRYEVSDSIFYKDIPKGTVAKQNPRPGSKVKENRRIYLTLNAISPEKVPMPNVRGLSLREARLKLNMYGLNLGKISYKPDFAVNAVLEQKVNDTIATPGVPVIKGSDVNLILGMGLSNVSTRVPDLTGFSLYLAKEMLADRYLNMGGVIYDGTVLTQTDTGLAFVYKQYPLAKEENKLFLGSNVDLWLTVDSSLLPKPDSLIIEDDFDDLLK